MPAGSLGTGRKACALSQAMNNFEFRCNFQPKLVLMASLTPSTAVTLA